MKTMNHNHEIVFQEVLKEGEFSFHPFLASALRKKFLLNANDILVIHEKKCNNSDCPIVETIIEFTKDKKYKVRFFRRKEQINKADILFAKLEELKL